MKNYQYLNLEQKMLRIRRKMPTLLKRFYNDEADYDFPHNIEINSIFI